MSKSTVACKHERLDASRRCKACGSLVDIQAKRNKHSNRWTEVDGIWFQSAKEARRYQELSLEQYMGTIADLELQPGFDLIVNGEHICRYIADFRYIRRIPGSAAGKITVEDAKPGGKSFKKTQAYRMFVIKKNLMKACHKIEVIEA